MATSAFYGYGASVSQYYGCHGVILLKITANLIDKICYYASCINELSLIDSKNCNF